MKPAQPALFANLKSNYSPEFSLRNAKCVRFLIGQIEHGPTMMVVSVFLGDEYPVWLITRPFWVCVSGIQNVLERAKGYIHETGRGTRPFYFARNFRPHDLPRLEN